jgi:hypothetical protein
VIQTLLPVGVATARVVVVELRNNEKEILIS